jgi:serine/threonine protein kinase
VIPQRVLDRFQLQERLGSGGFGTVYRGWDERLERPVAVKTFEGERARDPRVVREAQAAARLAHPGIVALFELGSDAERTYLISELVEGRTLAALGRAGELSDRDVAEIGAELCSALRHAHDAGVVHRDIKPHNILVAERSGRAKLMDFGIAHVLGAETLTRTGDVMGTIAYMAPEQADGERAGPRADVYSLALTLYECWAGSHPVARRSPAATARAIGGLLPSLGEARPELPPELIATIDLCLLPEPEERPGLEELAGELEDAAPHLSRAPLRAIAEPAWRGRGAALAGRLLWLGVPALIPLAGVQTAAAAAVLLLLATLIHRAASRPLPA